jgi:hypothetical protein
MKDRLFSSGAVYAEHSRMTIIRIKGLPGLKKVPTREAIKQARKK